MILPERKGWALLFTGEWVSCCWVPKIDDPGWSENCMLRCNALKNGHLPERKGLGEWAVAESQRGMTQDNVKRVCRCATPWKMSIFLRGRVEAFAGGWVSCCWVRKRDETEDEMNNYKTDKRNRKGKYNHLVWCNLMYKKVFFILW